MIRRRTFLTGGLALAAALARATPLLTMLVGARAGTAADAGARAFAPFLVKHLRSYEVAIRNVPGDAGLAAFHMLADSPPSGATIGWVATPVLAARVVDHDEPGLLPRIRLLGSVLREPIAFVSPASAPLDSVQDIIRRAGEDAEAVPLGTPPAGSPPHLAALRLQALTQTKLTIVTFPSAQAARHAVLGGNVSAAVLGLTDVMDDLRESRLVGLGIAARNRAGFLPDLPVLNEAGVPLSAAIRRGIAAPAGLPPEWTDRLVAALKGVAEDPAFKELADRAGFMVGWMDGPAWEAQVEAERVSLAKLWATDPWVNASGG